MVTLNKEISKEYAEFLLKRGMITDNDRQVFAEICIEFPELKLEDQIDRDQLRNL